MLCFCGKIQSFRSSSYSCLVNNVGKCTELCTVFLKKYERPFFSILCFVPIAMMMPGAMPTSPPAINPQQLAEQQQAFINQQALLMVRIHAQSCWRCQSSNSINHMTNLLAGPADDNAGNDTVPAAAAGAAAKTT